MKVYEIKNAITESVAPDVLEYFNGLADELVNELVIVAQRESVEAAAIALTSWAKDPERVERYRQRRRHEPIDGDLRELLEALDIVEADGGLQDLYDDGSAWGVSRFNNALGVVRLAVASFRNSERGDR